MAAHRKNFKSKTSSSAEDPVSSSIAYMLFLPLSVKMEYMSKEFAYRRNRFLVGAF